MSDDVPQDDVKEKVDSAESTDSSSLPSTRRGFFEIGSFVLGAIVGIGPAIFGLIAFLDPLLRKPTKPKFHKEATSGGDSRFIRVTSLEVLLPNVPKRFLVIADQIDAWNFTPDEPVGAVYIEKLSDSAVRVFNTTCPHAGCSVACTGTEFRCPCHNSSFNLDGSKLVSESGQENPSPRDLDSLEYEIRDGEIWVDFKRFYTGKPEKKEKA